MCRWILLASVGFILTPHLVRAAEPEQALSANSASEKNLNLSHSLTLYFGQSNRNDLLEIIRLQLAEFEPYLILGIAYNQQFLDVPKYFDLEWAGQLVKHFEKLDLFEANALVIFRWNWFPWNSYVPTSLGLGEGLSLASGFPSSEAVSQNIRALLLNYLLINITFSLPQLPEWALDFRLHHRSGIYGTLFGVHGGSNYVCLGITRRF